MGHRSVVDEGLIREMRLNKGNMPGNDVFIGAHVKNIYNLDDS